MADANPSIRLWSICEYFLTRSRDSISLESFERIQEVTQRSGPRDTYVFEKISRKVLARNAKGIKRFALDAVERERLGQMEKTAKTLEKTMCENLCKEIKGVLDKVLVNDIIRGTDPDKAADPLLELVCLYYAFYKNRDFPDNKIPAYYTGIFMHLAIMAHKGGRTEFERWQQVLRPLLLKEVSIEGCDLTRFFEHKLCKTIASKIFAELLSFLREEEERVVYIFEVVNDLTRDQLKNFKCHVANGFYSSLGRKKRFKPVGNHNERYALSQRQPIFSAVYLDEIVFRAVGQHFDRALDEIIQYYQSQKIGKARKSFNRNFDRLFLEMNRRIWRETLDLVAVQTRVLCRNRHLLRVIIFHLFETDGKERDFWKKYIPGVEKIIHFIFRDEKEELWQITQKLESVLEGYRNTDIFDGTDWDGFYGDDETQTIACRVIRVVVERASSRYDTTMPQAWFSDRLEKGIDDVALYRFFKQAAVKGLSV